jgi:GNAT superfamily N-acetyltransferase
VREEDAQTIGLLWEQLVMYHRERDTAMPIAAADGAYRYSQRVVNSIRDPYVQTLVAEYDGEVVGYVMGTIVDLLPEMFEAERAGFLADIYVVDGLRGQGIGRALVKALTDWFRGRGIGHMEWYVASSNAEGIAFWESIGGFDVMRRMRLSLNDNKE